ncbi:MAG: TraB/GumN family protein [Candidatus Thiodiazotropha sp.]|jgi:uncharacterized protein
MRRFSIITISVLCIGLLLMQVSVAAEKGLLWRISGKGDDSYLFGTMHSDDPRITQLPAIVKSHYNQADTLMLEIALDQSTTASVAALMMQAPQETLSKQIGVSLAHEASQALESKGIPPSVTEMLKPWAVVMTLSMPRMESGQFLDKQLYDRAVASGKQFHPLETPEEQISILSSLSLDEQKSLLRHVLDEYQTYPRMFERLTEAYLARDLGKINDISLANPISTDSALQDKVMTRMLLQRNQHMFERMKPFLSRGKVFIAIGALHLIGDEGLIALLRQHGYKVNCLY